MVAFSVAMRACSSPWTRYLTAYMPAAAADTSRIQNRVESLNIPMAPYGRIGAAVRSAGQAGAAVRSAARSRAERARGLYAISAALGFTARCHSSRKLGAGVAGGSGRWREAPAGPSL